MKMRVKMNKAQLEEAIKLASRPYNITVSQDRLSNGSKVYMARNPELAGCKAQGNSPTDAINNLRDARIDYIYYLIEDGLEVPVPATQTNITSSQIVEPQPVQFKAIISNRNKSTAEMKRLEAQEDLPETWSISEPVSTGE
jgi:predicted RNase H-like HicB family nuclease